MGIRKGKRLPLGKERNFPNTGDTKGRRLYARGTVGAVKRTLEAAGMNYKKVRASGFPGIVEVVYTQQGRDSPFSVLWNDKDTPLASTYRYTRRRRTKGCSPYRGRRI